MEMYSQNSRKTGTDSLKNPKENVWDHTVHTQSNADMQSNGRKTGNDSLDKPKKLYDIKLCTHSQMQKYINDSPRRFANCLPKAMYVLDKPRVLFFATKFIPTCTELRFDYRGICHGKRFVSRDFKCQSVLHLTVYILSCVFVTVRSHDRPLGLNTMNVSQFSSRLGLVSIPSLQRLGLVTPKSQSRLSLETQTSRSRHHTSRL